MPEPTDEELGIPEGLDPHIRDELRKSRTLARDNTALTEQLAAAQRSEAFAKAGIPESPLNAVLAQSYTGENDPAAIKAYFEGLGVSAEAPAAPVPDPNAPTEAELAAQRAVSQLGGQGATDGSIPLEVAMKNAKSVDELMAIVAAAPETATDMEGRRISVPGID